MCWRVEAPDRFARVVECLGFDSGDELSEGKVRFMLQASFSFSTYLAFTSRVSCLGMISISALQLLMILGVKVIVLALIHVQHVQQATTYSGFVFAAVCSIGLCHVVTAKIKHDLDRSAVSGQEMYSSLPLRFLRWLGELRCLRRMMDVPNVLLGGYQLLLFFSCFHFAGILISPELYDSLAQGHPLAVVQFIIYVVFFGVLLVVMPRAIPDFSCVTALPPFFNFRNQNCFSRCSTCTLMCLPCPAAAFNTGSAT